MLAACDAAELFALLEGGASGARGAADALVQLYSCVRDPWLVRALLTYHARTGSARAVELLARAPEPHARHLQDALAEQLRAAEPAARRAALASLAPLVARRPAWLHRLQPHPPPPLPRDLLRAARLETEPLPLLHALLALAALLPAAPALAAPHWPELADTLLRPATLEPPPPPAARVHLQLGQLALFHALYATHPVTLLETLRTELEGAPVRDAWERSLAPLLGSVRLHPALVTSSRQREADKARRLEEHDVVAETRRLTLYTPERRSTDEQAPPAATAPGTPLPTSAAQLSRAVSALRPGAEPWFALAELVGADSAPHTPLPAEADAGEPPEAAVEATPENTPAKETRVAFRFPSDSLAVRAIGRRKETSPPATGPVGGAPGEAYSRLARVVAERRAAESPVPFAGAPPPPPPGALRPQPRALRDLDDTFNLEDREVVELTERATAGELAWSEGDSELSPAERVKQLDPRKGESCRSRPRSRAPSKDTLERRSSSWPGRGQQARGGRASVSTQTVDTWPEPYEFLIADFYRDLPDITHKKEEGEASTPCERLDRYLASLYSGTGADTGAAVGTKASPPASELAEQLALAHAQLLYERWRREAHAERNRRLLGRCRKTRALELNNAALRDRLAGTARERDQLRACLAAERARTQPAGADVTALASTPLPDREQLEAALAEEKRLRARAEAALHECEASRAAAAAELQRSRGESFEAARHVEALARAALAAERRAEHVRRLRRELLVLAEREARLSEATRGGMTRPAAGSGVAAAAAAEERTLRAAVARAEAEAAAAVTRCDAMTARAHELEAALAVRDAQVAELKRATRHAADEQAGRLRALTDKYQALMAVLRAAEGRRLDHLAAAPAHITPHTPSAPTTDS